MIHTQEDHLMFRDNVYDYEAQGELLPTIKEQKQPKMLLTEKQVTPDDRKQTEIIRNNLQVEYARKMNRPELETSPLALITGLIIGIVIGLIGGMNLWK